MNNQVLMYCGIVFVLVVLFCIIRVLYGIED